MRIKPAFVALAIAAISPAVAAQSSPALPEPPVISRGDRHEEVVKKLSEFFKQVQESGQITLVGPFVVQDGAVYLWFPFSRIRVPMPGGGASGCFDANIAIRAQRMRVMIEKLPPLSERPR